MHIWDGTNVLPSQIVGLLSQAVIGFIMSGLYTRYVVWSP